MIFSCNKGKLSAQKEIGFKLEKDLQRLVETNLETILGLKFIATEFSIESYRFDTVAFNEDTKSFTIIEYKRGKSESLVDQGYAYMYTLLDRKADFVLLYNETTKKTMTLKDFDWSQTRIVFISPQFTDYQKNATAFINMPFELYEIKQYETGIISVNLVNETKKVKSDTVEMLKDDKVAKVAKEVVVYTEQDALTKCSDSIQELYYDLKSQIVGLGNIKIEPKKLYIAFKGKTNICDFVLSKNKIRIFINLKKGQLKDPLNQARLVKEIGHWGNGDYEFAISNSDSIESIPYLLSLIKQSYDINA